MRTIAQVAEESLGLTEDLLAESGVTVHSDGVTVFPTQGSALAGFVLRFDGTSDGTGEAHHLLVAAGKDGSAALMLTDEGRRQLAAFLGPDVRDRIIDRLILTEDDGDGLTYQACRGPDGGWSWSRHIDDPEDCGWEPMAPDEAAYFEARRASDG